MPVEWRRESRFASLLAFSARTAVIISAAQLCLGVSILARDAMIVSIAIWCQFSSPAWNIAIVMYRRKALAPPGGVGAVRASCCADRLLQIPPAQDQSVRATRLRCGPRFLAALISASCSAAAQASQASSSFL
jgi:hypothetical protein